MTEHLFFAIINIDSVEDWKMMCTQGLRDYDGIYSLKILAHFRSKVFVTQINCLTGAIISETYIRHILRRLYLTTIRSSAIEQNVELYADFESVEKTNVTVRQPNALVDFIPPVRDYEFSYGPLRAT